MPIASSSPSQQPLDDISKLNATVAKKCQDVVAKGKTLIGPHELPGSRDENGLPVEVRAVLDGRQVYHRRYRVIVYAGIAFAAFAVTQAPPLGALLFWSAFMFFYVDWFGGILHVCLDNPKFISLPLIDAGCLEFQFHHHIPNDIVSKDFVEVLGDLNGIVALTLSFVFIVCKGLLGWSFPLKPALLIGGLKLGFAYLGQYAHRMAHATAKQRPAWVTFAQNNGLMVSPEAHKTHHRVYNDSFPILSGQTSGLLSRALKIVPHEYFWLALFSFSMIFDVQLMAYAHGYVTSML